MVIHKFEPKCFEEAVGKRNWDATKDEEIAALDVNHTWEFISLPHDKSAIECKWVYKIKHNVDGSVSRYSARLAAKGYGKAYGID